MRSVDRRDDIEVFVHLHRPRSLDLLVLLRCYRRNCCDVGLKNDFRKPSKEHKTIFLTYTMVRNYDFESWLLVCQVHSLLSR